MPLGQSYSQVALSPIMPEEFQLNSKTLFLTYAQCPIPWEDFVSLLFDLPVLANLNGYVVSSEEHADGGLHYHCLLSNSQPVRIRDPHLLDVSWNGVNYHPNIQSPRHIRECYEYVTKGEEVWEDLGALQRRVTSCGNTWADALAAADFEEACEIIQRYYPREWILYGDRIRTNLRHQFPEPVQQIQFPTFPPQSFNAPTVLTDWVRDHLNNPDKAARRKSLILYGPSRTGKSCWARSLGNHIYQTSQLSIPDLLNKLDEDYVILDDFPEDSLTRDQVFRGIWKNLFGCQPAITLRPLYRNAKVVPWSIPVIWVCNNLPEFPDPDWMRENVVIVQIRNNIY